MARAASWRGCKLRGGRGVGGADGIRFRADHLVRCGEIWQDAQPGVTVNGLSIPLERNPFASRLLVGSSRLVSTIVKNKIVTGSVGASNCRTRI